MFLDNVQDIVIEYTDGKDDDDWAFPSSYDSSKYISVQNVYKLFKRIDEQLGRRANNSYYAKNVWFVVLS